MSNTTSSNQSSQVPPTGSQQRLTVYLDAFLEEVTAGKNNETRGAYQQKIRQLFKYLGEDASPENLTYEKLIAFRIDLQTRKNHLRGKRIVTGALSPYTIRTTLVAVKTFIKWMHKRGYIRVDLTNDWRIPQPTKPDPKPCSPETLSRLLQAAEQIGDDWEQARNLALLYLLVDTGGRISGLLDADIDKLDLQQGRLETREKGKNRTLYLTSPAIAAVRMWLGYRAKMADTHYILVNNKGGKLTRSGVYGILRRLADKGDVSGRHNPHSFRHAFARDILSNGGDLSHVSQLLGHSSIVVTSDYYTRWADEELRIIHQKTSPGRNLPMPKSK